MASQITPHLISLVQDSALKSFWRKEPLRQFLRGCGIQAAFISSWSPDETKRSFLYRLIEALQKSKAGNDGIRRMASFLAEQTSFPDLDGWEDSTAMKNAAIAARSALIEYLAKEKQEIISETEKAKARTRFAELKNERVKHQIDLDKLNQRLTELSKKITTAQAGYDFQPWFYDLMDYFEIDSRRPYVITGSQIDGSVTVEGTTYLVELKFTGTQAGAPDIDTFYKKVVNKADNTMGIMVSISGYSSVAVDEASSDRTPLLLLDYNHVYSMLNGTHTFADIVRRVRRHASQTGMAFLSVAEF